MAINDNITVLAGKTTTSAPDVETTSTIKHATTGKVYASESDAETDVNNPATSTKKEDIKRDVAITVNKLPDILGGSS
jgi:hypothetical protein|tara:strand:+ start:321 stop:554 length:234 start_codon:yes stop_codon:yes gene_type:complete